ncbi:MAG TPA: hypothetical protein VFO76_01625, partial [Candidatus Kapabacteria bacterium]|nr:hypothetical protein [Candidatus Kapabacteria bacterium]
KTADLSYDKYHLSITGKWYLTENPVVYKVDSGKVVLQGSLSTSVTKPKIDTLKSVPSRSLSFEDSILLIATSLNSLSERFDAMTVRTDKELKDSLSESLAAVAEILTEESYTESVHTVIVEEFTADEKLLVAIPFAKSFRDSVLTILKKHRQILEHTNTENGTFPAPEPLIETTNAATATPTKQTTWGVRGTLSPTITLVDATTDLWEFGAADVMAKGDLDWRKPTTLGTQLTIPVEFTHQRNRDPYTEFSYDQYDITPRLVFYPLDNIGLGIQYGFSSTIYPNDTLFTYSENRIRIDATVGIDSWWVLGVQSGISFRNYPYPRTDTTGVIRRITTREAEDFSEQQLGLTSTFLISDETSVGIGGVITKSPALRSYLLDARVGRSPVGGKASDDQFSYELSKGFLYLSTQLFSEFDLGVDVSYEERKYGTDVNRKLNSNQVSKLTRTDHGIVVSTVLSDDVFFDHPLLSVFDIITPQLSVQYQDYNSTLKLFTYNDLTISFSVSALF